MSRKREAEVISQLFQENQVWHREIMGIITNQALDAILAQQIIEQIFAFAPSPPRSYSQCQEEQVSQRRFPRIIFGSRHCQHRVPPSSNHSGLACRLVSEVANAHRFADTEWPGAPWKTLSPGQGWLRRDGDSLGQSEPGSLTSQTQTRGGSLPVVDRIVEPLRLCPLLFGRFDVLLNLRSNRRDLLPGVFRIFRIGLTHGFGLPFTDSLPHEGGTVGFSHITAVNKEVDHAHITAIVIDLNFPASQSIEQAWTHIPVPLE